MYSIVKVINSNKKVNEVLCLGSIVVLPEYQHRGIENKLINDSLNIAKKLKYNSVILYGYYKYYNRFGFINVEKYNIYTEDGINFEEFMALELYKVVL